MYNGSIENEIVGSTESRKHETFLKQSKDHSVDYKQNHFDDSWSQDMKRTQLKQMGNLFMQMF